MSVLSGCVCRDEKKHETSTTSSATSARMEEGGEIRRRPWNGPQEESGSGLTCAKTLLGAVLSESKKTG